MHILCGKKTQHKEIENYTKIATGLICAREKQKQNKPAWMRNSV